jgi:hypothetical protein
MFYKDKKFIGKYIYKLKALGLAIWFMDDGSYNNNRYFLHTNCFDIKSLHLLQKVLKHNFNINTSLNKCREGQYTIYIKAVSRQIFTDLISPYICESMKYKIQRL